jgi:hypothetical protein
MVKAGSIGALVGIGVGILLTVLYPSLLEAEFIFRILQAQSLQYPPNYYSPKDGSVFSVGSFIPLVFGILGYGIGLVIYKVKQTKERRHRAPSL